MLREELETLAQRVCSLEEEMQEVREHQHQPAADLCMCRSIKVECFGGFFGSKLLSSGSAFRCTPPIYFNMPLASQGLWLSHP